MPTQPEPARAATLDTRELDRQIAERLGWKPYQRDGEWWWQLGDRKWSAPEGYATSADAVFDYLHYNGDGTFNYSTDMNAAIELLKLMPMGGLTIDEDGDPAGE